MIAHCRDCITYYLDDSLASTGFTNETIATPDISHTYDTYYPRALTIVDANGTTTYSYVAPGTNGAGGLASVDGPFTNDAISYTYDDLGRVLTRMLNGTGTEITYDTLGRLSQLEFPIGAFDYTYVGQTGRRASVTYPNNQTTTYSYLDDEHDFRLQTIHHKNPSAATLSKFDYSYDTVGNILTWRQERAGSAAKLYTFTHDLVDQLTSAVLTDTSTPATILKRQAWAYDAAGNRTVDQTDDAVFATTHDAMNRLQARAPGGPIVFAGSLNEAGTVTIDGKPASVDASNNFTGTAQLGAGTTTVTVKAKDASGNETTQQYEVDASGSTSSYTYDANGNLTADGTKTYSWNALNQLVEVKQSTTTLATFEYDGAGRRTEKAAAGLTHNYVYDAEDIIEERVSGSSVDTVRFFHGAGIDEPLARKNGADVVTYYLADHLGSIVQEAGASGLVTLEREYDLWGRLNVNAEASGFAYTGREWDGEVSLYYYRNRYYDPSLSRFIGEDPIGLAGGLNLHAYVLNGPNRANDPFGLDLYIVANHTYTATLSVYGPAVVTVTVGEQFVVNPRTGEVTTFTSGAVGGGLGMGYRYSNSNEVGIADLNSPDEVGGFGLFVTGAAAAGHKGGSVTYSGNGGGSQSLSAGHSVGGGASVTGGGSYSGFKKRGNVKSLPDGVRQAVEKMMNQLQGRCSR